MSSSKAATMMPSPLNPQIWRVCAGAAVQFPTVNSRVIYFPQGHMDQASSLPKNLSPLLLSNPFIRCTISTVQFLADPHTDEVFAKLLLYPEVHLTALPRAPAPAATDNGDNITSFVKILTPSDANNGGGFSVPKYCAESIFPPLNYNADPPVQNISITDVHGKAWVFRHIYRGTPRRHLLTSGWGKFVNSKNLVAGDSVVFMKNSRGEIFIGIRRAARFTAPSGNAGDRPRWFCPIRGARNRAEEEQQEENRKEGFSRDGKGRLSPKSVAEAAELAAQNLPFEVVYYPKAGWSDFVVKAEVVDKALIVGWSPGMRVKMAVETDDSTRMTWFQGTVSSLSVPNNNGPWGWSPWRMLQITWDEPMVLQNSKWVSPWQVELVSITPPLYAAYPPHKMFRTTDGSAMSVDGGGDPFFSTGLADSTMVHFSQTLLSYGTLPARMQGARHDHFSASSFSNLLGDNSPLCMGNSSGNNTVLRLQTLSTELNVGSSRSDNMSPDSQSSLPSFGTEFVKNHSCNPTKPGPVSFQLFGTVIQLEQSVESGSHCTGSGGDDSSKGCNETEGSDTLLSLDNSLTLAEIA